MTPERKGYMGTKFWARHSTISMKSISYRKGIFTFLLGHQCCSRLQYNMTGISQRPARIDC